MVNILLAVLVIGFVVYGIGKKYKVQVVLLTGGMMLLAFASLLHTGTFLEAESQTGFWLFDIFKYIAVTLTEDTKGFGLILMSVGGFAVYMEKIGASSAMVHLCIKPLKKLNAPYFVLALSYIVGQIMNLFIPSAVGLGVLLMATLYPILVELGVSKLSAASVIVTSACLDLGPASGGAIKTAETSGLDVMDYFIHYQIPVGVVVAIVIAVLHFFIQRYCDRKMGFDPSMAEKNELDSSIPKIYAILPLVPLFLLFTFSEVDLFTAMLISVTIAILFELVRYKGQLHKVTDSIQIFFNSMGDQFARVVTLIVAGKVFGQGLISIGAIDIIIDACQNSGFGPIPMTIIMVLVIVLSTIVMGSSGAPFFAFIGLAPTVASLFGIPTVMMAMPMQLSAGLARSMSPISAVTVACVGRSEGITPVDVIKRTGIPMLAALVVMLFGTFLFL